MKKYKFLLQAVSIFAFALLLFQNTITAQSRVDRILIGEATRITNDEFPNFTTTPKGSRVYSVNRANSKTLDAIDKGLKDLFAVAAKHDYSQKTDYADYTIFIAKPDRLKDINNQYSPDIAVGAAQYAGSIYDKGGYIYAAGMVVAFKPCAFVIGEHTKNLERVSEVVRYEGEHLILYHNDPKLYNKTKDHSKGGGHPILQ
jgi:hypothetical protein